MELKDDPINEWANAYIMRTVFVDRDGVINKDTGYVHKIEDFEFSEGVFDSFKYLKSRGFDLIIVTNQSGIGRGYYKEQDFNILTHWMLNRFNEQGIAILDVLYCPHKQEDNCNCRKPRTGMLEEADKKYKIDKKNSWMIGDKESDISAANTFGISNTILIKNDRTFLKQKSDAQFILPSLNEISNYIR
ncbi:D-glycero-beta-D-manno-heptose 1,7-bisphosphate 7-phosphatase [Spongiimicrobium salis]|uniref:D-glycero-beta-D-manno-heptose 1,7-bisphosphate 7-phosphatase n=1 Tax=Spongiimicrobium salis TaxID=1667022 RepID=UPI00374DDF4E